MTILQIETQEARVQTLPLIDETMTVELYDGRKLSVPLAWSPRLVHASKNEHNNRVLFGGGTSIHWPHLDEDIGVDGLLAGLPSSESKWSFERWLKAKNEGRGLTIPELDAYDETQDEQLAQVE